MEIHIFKDEKVQNTYMSDITSRIQPAHMTPTIEELLAYIVHMKGHLPIAYDKILS